MARRNYFDSARPNSPRRASALILALVVSLASVLALASPADASTAAGGRAWSGWSEVPGAGQTTDAPSAVKYSGKHYLFVRGTDNLIYRNVLTSAGWSGWSEVPGGGSTTSAPAASVYRGALRLYVRGTNDLIYVNRSTDN